MPGQEDSRYQGSSKAPLIVGLILVALFALAGLEATTVINIIG